ncbi:MAG: CBS domain-containing protein [Planctomycetota bacterium]
MDFKLSLQSETIRSAYPETPVAVEPDTPIADVIRLMQAERAPAVLICDADELVGVFTERDVLRLLSKQADLSPAITTVMTRGPSTVTDSATVGDAISQMAVGGYRHLPIVSAINPTEPTAIVDVRGVLHYLVDHFPSTIYNLPPQSPRATAEREGA